MNEASAVDWTAVLLALISLVGTTVTAVLAYLAQVNARAAREQGQETAKAVNGVVDRLMETKDQVIMASEAKGKAEGKVEVLEKDGP